MKVKVPHSSLTLCDPMDNTVHGILQARILEWSGENLPSPGDLPNPGTEPRSPALQADSLHSPALQAEPQGKPLYIVYQRANESLAFFFFFITTVLPTEHADGCVPTRPKIPERRM